MNDNESQLSIATRIARSGHEGQFRRDGFTPYFEHVWRVSMKLLRKGESDEVAATALLHDYLEDTNFSPRHLYTQGLEKPIVDAVIAMTKSKSEEYDVYLNRVKANPIALKVKIADMLDNLSDAPTDSQILKYAKGLLFLLS